MNIAKIVTKNMRQRALATWLTAISVALGVALSVAILLVKQGVQRRFEQGTLGYEMVVGAKGSPLQLVLNTVYNLDVSPGNVSWKLFEQLRDETRETRRAVLGRRQLSRLPHCGHDRRLLQGV